MLLFGDANNPSNGFYERMGGEKLFAENGEFHGGYRWRNFQMLVSNCLINEPNAFIQNKIVPSTV